MNGMIENRKRLATMASLLSLPLVLAGCEFAPTESTQLGPAGAAMEQVTNLSLVQPISPPPPSAYTLETRDGQRAKEIYPGLKALGDISVEEFGLLMANITEWVVPKDAPAAEAGCNYCHNPENMASYEKYTKTVSLKMIQMTQSINVDYVSHVKETGVTCYTCHRGQAVPAYNWSFMEDTGSIRTIRGNKSGQNTPEQQVAFASLPYDIFAPYFADNPREIRVNTTQIHPYGDTDLVPIQQAEQTYGLMMHMSSALGVNCTFCHNSQNFGEWSHSRVQKQTAWYGIRMVRDLNNTCLNPLQPVFPPHRLGAAMGDAPKVNCATCHNGVYKPLFGEPMARNFPALRGPGATKDEAEPAAAMLSMPD